MRTKTRFVKYLIPR